jgi:hypothetical protein
VTAKIDEIAQQDRGKIVVRYQESNMAAFRVNWKCMSSKLLVLQSCFGHLLESLPDAQVAQDFLRSAQDSVEFVRAMELFNNFSHTTFSDTTTSKDVACIVRDFVGTASGEGLEQADGSAEMLILVCIRHCVHLVRDLLEPGLGGFCVLNHASKPEK